MALAIKAIPTLYGDEARRFRDMADEAESRYETTDRKDRDTNPFVISLICANRQSTTFNNIRACARQYTAFHAKSKGEPLCFYAMPLAKATFSATQILLRK